MPNVVFGIFVVVPNKLLEIGDVDSFVCNSCFSLSVCREL